MNKFTISVFTLCISSVSFADGEVKSTQSLNSSDSAILESKHLSPYTPHLDADGWETLSSSYKTSDGAFTIDCSVRNVGGVLINQSCTIMIDSTKSKGGVTGERVGVVGKVNVVDILNAGDASSLITILNPLPFYETVQKVQVTLPNGQASQAAKFRIDCDGSKNTCRALLFP